MIETTNLEEDVTEDLEVDGGGCVSYGAYQLASVVELF